MAGKTSLIGTSSINGPFSMFDCRMVYDDDCTHMYQNCSQDCLVPRTSKWLSQVLSASTCWIELFMWHHVGSTSIIIYAWIIPLYDWCHWFHSTCHSRCSNKPLRLYPSARHSVGDTVVPTILGDCRIRNSRIFRVTSTEPGTTFSNVYGRFRSFSF